ncbi:hypothetical protein B7P43_G14588 [Cryptotermes secundus]|uniref:Uncharacterized protein n=1 Tax=Cryptotermes secundus TaxID=105785 RepID=A0A2J7QGG3_9NEOP|nr:hypothetical protein B7P43_G14588 [Cryptotermes secundus]
MNSYCGILGYDNVKSVGLEVLTAMVMKSTILWDIAPCSPLNINRCSFETSADFQQTT